MLPVARRTAIQAVARDLLEVYRRDVARSRKQGNFGAAAALMLLLSVGCIVPAMEGDVAALALAASLSALVACIVGERKQRKLGVELDDERGRLEMQLRAAGLVVANNDFNIERRVLVRLSSGTATARWLDAMDDESYG